MKTKDLKLHLAEQIKLRNNPVSYPPDRREIHISTNEAKTLLQALEEQPFDKTTSCIHHSGRKDKK